jgi:hypothetical protein
MAALAVFALLWGNCLSCPEMMVAMTSHQPDHSCCHKPQAPSAKCHTEAMQQVVMADTYPPVVPAVAVLADVPAPATLSVEWLFAPLPVLLAPPGSPTLPATLRV